MSADPVAPGVDRDALLQLAVDAAEAAGAGQQLRAGDVHTVAPKSSATDPVSEADRAAETLLVERLRAARPDDGFLGEEGADRAGTSGLRWVLDPLDGTVNYLYGLPAWCVSVACEDADGGLVGAICDPLRGETFRAARGHGAWLGRERLAVNDPVALERALVATGFAYDPAARALQGARAGALLPQVRDLRRAGSAALDLCNVAAGRVDGYYEAGVGHWDWAAGALIAAESGATVSRYTAADGRHGLVVAGPALHDPLRAAAMEGG
jgi:myo-inositol-1(or 4)-monophosphatase